MGELVENCKMVNAMSSSGVSRGGGGVLPRILDRGVPRRFVNPNPI